MNQVTVIQECVFAPNKKKAIQSTIICLLCRYLNERFHAANLGALRRDLPLINAPDLQAVSTTFSILDLGF
jgi:hypothetical protein